MLIVTFVCMSKKGVMLLVINRKYKIINLFLSLYNYLPSALIFLVPQMFVSVSQQQKDCCWSANFSANFCGWKSITWSAQLFPMTINFSFLDWSRYFFFEVALHLYS
jgi:hypothetical protein